MRPLGELSNLKNSNDSGTQKLGFWEHKLKPMYFLLMFLIRISSEGGTGEDRRIEPPLNFGKTTIISGKNGF